MKNCHSHLLYIPIVIAAVVIGYVVGIQHAYKQAAQVKEQFKAATIGKVEKKYEDYKQKIKNSLSNKSE